MGVKTKIKVTSTQILKVPIYKYIVERNVRTGEVTHTRTSEVLRVDEFERKIVHFSGSEDAFNIWKVRCDVPSTAQIDRTVKID